MTTYVNISKPSVTGYSNTNAAGKQQYDEADIIYDDPLVFYDSTNESMYTGITKPSGTAYTNITKPS